MRGLDHQVIKWYCMSQTLHNRIEEASVSMVLHRKSNTTGDCLLRKLIDLLLFHSFKAASFTFNCL